MSGVNVHSFSKDYQKLCANVYLTNVAHITVTLNASVLKPSRSDPEQREKINLNYYFDASL